MNRPFRLLVIGFILVLAGAVLPFLIVIGVLPSTFLLNFVAYGASITGIFMGVIGAASYARIQQDREDDWRQL